VGKGRNQTGTGRDWGIKPIRVLLGFLGRVGLLRAPEQERGQAVAIPEFADLSQGVAAVGRETACEDDLDLQEQDSVTKD